MKKIYVQKIELFNPIAKYTFIFVICAFVLNSATFLFAQKPRMNQDPKLNNLVHSPDYKTAKLGELGRVTKVGTGKQDMILIAGSGFGGEIWNEFMSTRKEQYTMYAVTLSRLWRNKCTADAARWNKLRRTDLD